MSKKKNKKVNKMKMDELKKKMKSLEDNNQTNSAYYQHIMARYKALKSK